MWQAVGRNVLYTFSLHKQRRREGLQEQTAFFLTAPDYRWRKTVERNEKRGLANVT